MDAGDDLGSAAKGLAIVWRLLALVWLAAVFFPFSFLPCVVLKPAVFHLLPWYTRRPSSLVIMSFYDIYTKLKCTCCANWRIYICDRG